jgi:hypothetical protein
MNWHQGIVKWLLTGVVGKKDWNLMKKEIAGYSFGAHTFTAKFEKVICRNSYLTKLGSEKLKRTIQINKTLAIKRV